MKESIQSKCKLGPTQIFLIQRFSLEIIHFSDDLFPNSSLRAISDFATMFNQLRFPAYKKYMHTLKCSMCDLIALQFKNLIAAEKSKHFQKIYRWQAPRPITVSHRTVWEDDKYGKSP